MTSLPLLRGLRLLCVVAAACSSVGCKDYLVVTTATKFGLEISQVAKEPPKIALGYKREETTIIPAEHRNTTSGNASEAQTDTYSVLAEFCVMANPSLWDFFRRPHVDRSRRAGRPADPLVFCDRDGGGQSRQ